MSKQVEKFLLSATEYTLDNDLGHNEIHAVEPPVPKPNSFEVVTATENGKGINHQILIKLQQN
jgi:hypothetical protein